MNDLLTLLSENARLTAAQLAVMLNKTEAEVAAAVKSYEESGVIKGYKALIDWDKAPVKSASAIIELKVTPKKETGFDEIARRVMAFDEVESVYLGYRYVRGKAFVHLGFRYFHSHSFCADQV